MNTTKKPKNTESNIFDPIESDNKAMNGISLNRWSLKTKPKGIRYIGYTLLTFFIILFIFIIYQTL
ncbi:hypothetical protein [Viridibacillus arvi]|uniref:Uncharacterized protein n=1 Tax=Viridibacillus arvi TaxID=263475 RepID=A0A0M0L6K1_9BACL|nr:hypothetical protein [Viridibacillus arvi]KOO46706.1 hypothetical protein AMD00_22560 [Viridibacillus arvi]